MKVRTGLRLGACPVHFHARKSVAYAWDEREPPFILWARHFPQYRTLHSDPRFASILLEMDCVEEQ